MGEKDENLRQVFITSDGIVRRMTIIGDWIHDLSEKLRKAVGFRNIAVHEYYKIDWEVVFSIISNSLDDFRKFTAAVMDIIENPPLN